MFDLFLGLIVLGFRLFAFLARMAGYALVFALAFVLAILGGGPEEGEAAEASEPREPSPGQADDGVEGGLPGWEAAHAEGSDEEAEGPTDASLDAPLDVELERTASDLSPAEAPTTF